MSNFSGLGVPVQFMVGTSPTYTTQNISTTITYTGIITQATQTVTVDRVYMRYNTITGSPGVLRFGLMSVDASGNPSGTWLGAGGLGYADFTPAAGDLNVFRSYTLGQTVTLNKGDIFYLVCKGQSGTWNASNSIAAVIFSTSYLVNAPYIEAFPAFIVVGSKLSYAAASGGRNCGWAYGDSASIFGYPIATAAQQSLTTSGPIDEVGTAFTLGTSGTGTYKVSGMSVYYTNDSSVTAGSLQYGLYNGTTLLQSVTIDDDAGQRGTTTSVSFYTFHFPTAVTCNYGTEYTVAIKTTNTLASSKAIITTWSALNPNNSNLGLNMTYKSRLGTGAWSTGTSSQFANIVPIFSDFVGGSGGGGTGGLLVHPGTAGGMRG